MASKLRKRQQPQDNPGPHPQQSELQFNQNTSAFLTLSPAAGSFFSKIGTWVRPRGKIQYSKPILY